MNKFAKFTLNELFEWHGVKVHYSWEFSNMKPENRLRLEAKKAFEEID